MEHLTWLADLKAFGPLGLALVILALAIRSIVLRVFRLMDTRESQHLLVYKETLQVIREHSEAIKKHSEQLDLERQAIIMQIRRTERNIKSHIDGKKS